MYELIEPFINIIIAGVAILIAMLSAYFAGSQTGKQKEQKKQLETALGNVQDAQENDDEIKRMDESAIDSELSKNGWMRDN